MEVAEPFSSCNLEEKRNEEMREFWSGVREGDRQMKNIPKSVCGVLVSWVPVVAVSCLLSAGMAAGQQNTICTSSTQCSTGKSPAFFDASVAAVVGLDFCSSINNTLNLLTYPSTGAVIDARGLPVKGVSMTCAAGTSPWFESGTYTNKPSTILLPAADKLLEVSEDTTGEAKSRRRTRRQIRA